MKTPLKAFFLCFFFRMEQAIDWTQHSIIYTPLSVRLSISIRLILRAFPTKNQWTEIHDQQSFIAFEMQIVEWCMEWGGRENDLMTIWCWNNGQNRRRENPILYFKTNPFLGGGEEKLMAKD